MMFQQSNSRNQKTKGSKIRTLVKVSVLLGVAVWLVYQIKQSHNKKDEFASNYDEKLSNRDGNEYLGRKGKAGSENVIIIETQDANGDESSETNESGGGEANRGNWPTEEKNEQEVNKEPDEPQDVFSNTNEKESQQEKPENKDENADSHNKGDHEATDKGENEEKGPQEGTTSNSNENQQKQLGNENGIADTQIDDSDQGADKSATEANGEVLQLPSQRESSSDQNENTKELEGNGEKSDNNEATVSTEENISSNTNQDKIDENAAHNSEPNDTTRDSENSGAVGSTDFSLPEDKSNNEESTNSEVRENEAVESTDGNNPVEDSTTDLRSGDELVNPSVTSEQNIAESIDNEALEKDIIESQRENTIDAEIMEKHTTETTDSDTKSAEEIANPSNENASGDSSSEEENTSNQSLSSEGAKLDDSKAKEIESQGNAASTENTDNSAGEVKTETSEGIVDSSQVDKQSDLQASADKVLDGEAVESRGDTASEAENASGDAQNDLMKTDSDSSSETNTELVDNVDVSGNGAVAEGMR